MVAGMEVEMRLPLEGDFAVELTEHAMIIRGLCPVDFCLALAKVAETEYGFDQMDFCMPQVLGAVWVQGSNEGLKTMRAEHEAMIALLHYSPYERWWANWDKGVSSMTMAYLLRGTPPRWQPPQHQDIPHDADDFGRCVRLLDAVPDLRPDLPQLAEKMPEWQPIAEAWDELEVMYRAGMNKELTERLAGI